MTRPTTHHSRVLAAFNKLFLLIIQYFCSNQLNYYIKFKTVFYLIVRPCLSNLYLPISLFFLQVLNNARFLYFSAIIIFSFSLNLLDYAVKLYGALFVNYLFFTSSIWLYQCYIKRNLRRMKIIVPWYFPYLMMIPWVTFLQCVASPYFIIYFAPYVQCAVFIKF